MKRFWGVLLVLMMGLLPFAATAELETRAMTSVMAQLTDAPSEGAAVLMEYYPGTRVEVVREADGAYVQVNVGRKGGSLNGYMKKEDLIIGEANIREFCGLEVSYHWQGWTMYSYCDTMSEVISQNNDTYVYAMGEYGDWIHVEQDVGNETITGFVHKAEMPEGEAAEKHVRYGWGIETVPLPGEVTLEEAIAYAKERLVADGERANGQGDTLITPEMLEGCRVETKVYLDYETDELIYGITFIYQDRTWEDGFPMICGFVQMWVEGEEIIRYNFGNG